MARTLVILLAAIVSLSTLGCPGKTDKTGADAKSGSGKSADTGPGGSSPEDLWEKLKACEGEGGKVSMGKVVPLCTKASQTELLGMGMMIAGFATMGKDMKADPAKEKLLYDLLEKHGLKRGENGKVEVKGKEAMEKIEDKAGLAAALMEFADEHGDGKSSNRGVGAMKEIKTDGDRATVSLVKKNRDGKEEPDVVVFLKEDGRWFFDLAETKKASQALKQSAKTKK